MADAPRACSISDAVTAAAITVMKPIPCSITTAPITRPLVASGTTSPYPTVVTVCSDHQRLVPRFGNSS